jgi:hypothetical protein
MDELNFNLASKKDILNNMESLIKDLPDETAINLIIKGSSAKKFLFVKTFLSSSFPEISEDDIVKFILRSGVQRELEKFKSIWNDIS